MPAVTPSTKVRTIPQRRAKSEVNDNAAIAAAPQSIVDQAGSQNLPKGKSSSCTVPNKVWSANQTARLRMTPTTAAVIPESACVSDRR